MIAERFFELDAIMQDLRRKRVTLEDRLWDKLDHDLLLIEQPGEINIGFPEYASELDKPYRYKILYGGRGGGRSWTVARKLLLAGAEKRLRILCTRELQTSIKDSVHQLLKDQIELLKQEGAQGMSEYVVLEREIRHRVTGTVFIFEGLRYNIKKIKSLEGVDICWVEEAERISKESWETLIPTIRKRGSEIWITFNPDLEEDPTANRFIVNTPPNALKLKVGWEDNPFFSETELVAEKDYLYSVDPEAADHVWGGNYRKASAASILRGKWVIEEFTVDMDRDNARGTVIFGPYQGLDFGFGSDPLAMNRVWIKKPRPGMRVDDLRGSELLVEYEAHKVLLELDDTTAYLALHVPDMTRHITRADNSRPESISYLKRHGMPLVRAADKWPGSVEDGIAFLRSFTVIRIHPRCVNTIFEAKHYSYKVDELTGEVLPIIVDKHNHHIDSLRYALDPMITGKRRKKNMAGQQTTSMSTMRM